MPCITGLAGEDCASDHWSPAVHGRRERDGWRAPCPLCRSDRALAYDAPGRGVRWKIWCPCDRTVVRAALADLGACLPTRNPSRAPIDHDALAALALARIPPMSLRLAMLELSGMNTTAALDKLGVRRENRSRVITGRAAASKRMQTRR